MGRGLSELQKHILIIGHRNRGAGDNPHDEFAREPNIDVGFYGILCEHFHWGFDETKGGLLPDKSTTAYFDYDERWGKRFKNSKVVTGFDGEPLERVENYDQRKIAMTNYKRGHYWYWRKFSIEAVGKSRYQSAMASITRAMQRLHERGFVTYEKRDWDHAAGCKLTPWGMYQAYRLRSGRKANKLTVSRPKPIELSPEEQERRLNELCRLEEDIARFHELDRAISGLL